MSEVEGDDMRGYKKEKYLNGQGTKCAIYLEISIIVFLN